MKDLQRQIDELKAQIDSLNSVSSIRLPQEQGIRARFQQILLTDVYYDFGVIGAGVTVSATFGIGDAQVGDIVIVGWPTVWAGDAAFTVLQAWIPANGSVGIRITNGGSNTYGSATVKYAIGIIKHQ